MITLKVEDYCHDCPDFEPDVEKNSETLHRNDPFTGPFYTETITFHTTTIHCKHRYRCESVKEYMRKQLEEEKKND